MMSEPPQISVLLPAFNAAQTLPAALDSVLAQRTGRLFEVVAVDDGSVDSTARVLATMRVATRVVARR